MKVSRGLCQDRVRVSGISRCRQRSVCGLERSARPRIASATINLAATKPVVGMTRGENGGQEPARSVVRRGPDVPVP